MKRVGSDACVLWGVMRVFLWLQLEDKVKEEMEHVLVEEYGVSDSANGKSSMTRAWDDIQQTVGFLFIFYIFFLLKNK